MKKHPNVLVISHNCFSKKGSNGRTLGNFFINWPKESLAQFYINNEIPDSEVCDKYFRVTDIEALKAFYKGAKVGKTIVTEEVSDDEEDVTLNNLYRKHKKRSSFNYIVRNFIWDSNRWKSEEFEKWVDNFNPEIILLQLGDYAFMLRIALKLAKKRDIPIIIYNSEDYYFKDRKSLSPLYHYYRNDYKRQVKKLISYASHSIYNSDMLQHTYQDEFKHQSTVIMTSTNITPKEDTEPNSTFVVSYLGNLGVGRHESLIAIAETLHELQSDIYLDVYGRVLNEEVEKALLSCTGIRLKGFVSYDEVIKVMKSSDLLVHAENFSDFYQWDLKHAFSTKIADSLASGTCFFVYAPENIAFVEYLKCNKAACVVTKPELLKENLHEIINNKELRQHFIAKALRLAKINHNKDKNKENFYEVTNQVVIKGE